MLQSMRLNIWLASVSLGVCGCFVPHSSASELKEVSVVTNSTRPTFSVNDASAVFERALPSHNEAENDKSAIDNSAEEARTFDLEDMIKNVPHFIEDHAVTRIKALYGASITEGMSENLPVKAARLVEKMNLLHNKKTWPGNENEKMLDIIQRLQDNGDPNVQQAGATGLVNMLRTCMIDNVDDARFDAGLRAAGASRTNFINPKQFWVDTVYKLLYVDELTAKQAQFYVAFLTKLSEQEIIRLALAVRDFDRGDRVIDQLLLTMVADPVTREQAFRLQLARDEYLENFLMLLCIPALDSHQTQNPASLPVNVWLEFLAYTRFHNKLSDTELGAFAVRNLANLDYHVGIDKKTMLRSIVENRETELIMNVENSEASPLVFKWVPDDRDEVKRFENYLIDSDQVEAFTAALEDEAVVNSFRAAEVLNVYHVLAEINGDHERVELLTGILKDSDYFMVFKEALRDRQVKILAQEFLPYVGT